MRNLEAKFRLRDLDAARAAALELGYAPRESFIQRDTFFVVARGKLKLREQPPEAWLIHYAARSGERSDAQPLPDSAGGRS